MSPHRLTRSDGVVASVLGTGRFLVSLTDGQSVRARLSRRLGFLHARFIVGDRVLVAMLPPAGNGLIITGARPAARAGH